MLWIFSIDIYQLPFYGFGNFWMKAEGLKSHETGKKPFSAALNGGSGNEKTSRKLTELFAEVFLFKASGTLRCHIRIKRVRGEGPFDRFKEKLKYSPFIVIQSLHQHSDNRMLTVDRIADAFSSFNAIPGMNEPFTAGPASSPCIDSAAGSHNFLYNPAEALSDLLGGMSNRFLYVERPEMVQGIGNVDPDAGKLRELLLSCEPEPSAPDNEATIAIDVESLISPQTFLSSSLRHLNPGEFADVRQDKRFYEDCMAFHRYLLFLEGLCGVMPGEKRIKGFHRVFVEENLNMFKTRLS
jgi:hypothetical protein